MHEGETTTTAMSCGRPVPGPGLAGLRVWN